MYKRFTFLIAATLFLLAGCAHHQTDDGSTKLTSIQLIDRNGFSETVSARERLSLYQNVDFLKPQPFQKVLRVFKRDREGKTHSTLTSYHSNGQVSQFLDITDGRAHGYYREWHPNGRMKLEAQVIEGIADFSEVAQGSWLFEGVSQVWDEQGRCLAKIPYSKGALQGLSLYYFPSGKLQKEIPYRQDEIDGVMTVYTENGRIEERISYIAGLKEGLAVGFWDNQKDRYVETYEKDLLKKGDYFTKTGEKIAEVVEGNGTQAHFEQGRSSRVEFKNGQPEGRVQLFGESGDLEHELHVKDGKKHGEEIEYFPKNHEGKTIPRLMVTWNDDRLHGVAKTWYENGVVQSQKEMSSNKKHGMSFAWYRDGSLMLSEEYENDKLMKGSYFKKGEKESYSKVEGGKGVASLFDAEGSFLKKVHYDKGKPTLQNDER